MSGFVEPARAKLGIGALFFIAAFIGNFWGSFSFAPALHGHPASVNEADSTTLPGAPIAPGNLTATAMSNTQIALAWTDNSTNEDSFKIERKLGLAGIYAEVAKLGVNTTSYSDTGLKPNTRYFYRVRASNSDGQSVYSSQVSATTLPNSPAVPVNLTTTAVSQTQINLVWFDKSTNETGFKIERMAGTTGTFTEIVPSGGIGTNVTSYSDTGLMANTQYSYRVRAYNPGGNSDYSNVAEATTLPNPPATPSELTATAVINLQIKLAWLDNSANEDSFKIERKTEVTGTYSEIAKVGRNVKKYTDTGLNPVTQYFYRVRASNTGGHSGYSNEADATTLNNPPVAPDSLTVTPVSSTRLNLAWRDNSGNESGFRIERKISATGTYKVLATVAANATSFSNGGLSTTSEYFYRVRAYNADGNSDYSNEVNAITLPLAPGNFSAVTVSNMRIHLTWTDRSDNETGFKIERKVGIAGTYEQIVPQGAIGANVQSFVDSSLTGNTTYFYRVAAFNAGGASTYSSQAKAKTLPDPPSAPESLTATAVSDSRIDLAWVDSSMNEDGFTIERKIGLAGAYTQIVPPGGLGANVTSFADTGLTVKTKYFYRVNAYNVSGFSNYSNEAGTVTLPVAPGGLTAVTVSKSKIKLTWADSSNNEGGFRIERKTAGGAYAEIKLTSPNVKSFADSGLAANTEYFYRVCAINAGGASGFTNEASATTLPNPPVAPFNLTATTISNTTLHLAWADSSDNETGFQIERKIAGGVYAQIVAPGGIGANVNSFVDSSLAAKTVYYYRARAFNAGGASGYSNEASARTLPNPPGPPSNLTATVAGSSKINLTWLDNAGNEQGFKIESKIGETGTYTEVKTTIANVTSYSHTGLTEGAPYFYRVRAYNAGGYSSYSNEVNATPSDDTNLALNKSTLASSTDTTSAASRAVDGNLLTFWNSGSVNPSVPLAWLQVRLNASTAVTIDRAVIKWYQTYFAKEYDIQLSKDGASWTTVYTNIAGAIGAQEATFAPTPARFIRLYLRKNNKASYRLAEFEVYFGAPKASGQSEKREARIPDNVTLQQNYPNPFSANGSSMGAALGNRSTTITYSLPKGMHATLNVVNLNGQIVATLANRYHERGEYRVRFDASNLPSGMYFCVLKAGEVTQVRRMVLRK